MLISDVRTVESILMSLQDDLDKFNDLLEDEDFIHSKKDVLLAIEKTEAEIKKYQEVFK